MWLQRVESIRARGAALLGARLSEIAFRKNTSEGLNIAANGLRMQPGDNVLLIEGASLALIESIGVECIQNHDLDDYRNAGAMTVRSIRTSAC